MAKILNDKELAPCDSIAPRVSIKIQRKYTIVVKSKDLWVI